MEEKEKTIRVMMNVAITAGYDVVVEIPEEEYNSKDFDINDWIPDDQELRSEMDMSGGVDVIHYEVDEDC